MKIIDSNIYVYLHKQVFYKKEFQNYLEYMFYVYGDDDQSYNGFNFTVSKFDFLYLVFLE